MNIFIFGASGHGKVVCEIAEALGLVVSVFVDNNQELKNLWDFSVLPTIPDDIKQGVIAIGCNRNRKKIAIKISDKGFLKLIHPFACISKRVSIGNGTVIMPGVIINADCRIGSHVIINTNSSIDHDCEVEDFVHVSPNVALSGGVRVGEGTHIGVGASVIPGVKIGKWVTIGAGSVIIRDIPDYSVVVGNPGRIIRTTI